jgi:hypothetical protein
LLRLKAFEDANEKGPYSADPLNVRGDALVKQGQRRESVAKYDEALRYAPTWKQFKEAARGGWRPKRTDLDSQELPVVTGGFGSIGPIGERQVRRPPSISEYRALAMT